ncbi:MAG: CheR family methyltransferase, partial [Balneolales bacterium]
MLIDDKELNVLLNEIYVYTGFDFRDYSVPSLKRRVSKCMREEKLHRPAEFRQKVLVSPQSLNRLLQALPVHVTAMFRDAGFYLFFKQQVIPWLKTYPFVRLWIAGCSTGEEVYSVAILLEEAGLLDRTLLYATDFNLVVL